jgi:hypothetical protein
VKAGRPEQKRTEETEKKAEEGISVLSVAFC